VEKWDPEEWKTRLAHIVQTAGMTNEQFKSGQFLIEGVSTERYKGRVIPLIAALQSSRSVKERLVEAGQDDMKLYPKVHSQLVELLSKKFDGQK
jgi:hypothetical protein